MQLKKKTFPHQKKKKSSHQDFGVAPVELLFVVPSEGIHHGSYGGGGAGTHEVEVQHALGRNKHTFTNNVHNLES